MAANGTKITYMSFRKIQIDPLLVHGIRPGILRQGIHITSHAFEAFENLFVVLQKDKLIVNVIASEQQPNGCGKRKTAITAIGRKPLVTGVRSDLLGQVIQIGERMHTEDLVPDHHSPRIELYILVYRMFEVEREILVQDSRSLFIPKNLFGRKTPDSNQTAFTDNALGLTYGIQKTAYSFGITNLLWNDKTPAQRREIALLADTLFGCLRQEKVTGMLKVRPFIEMPFKRAGEETLIAIPILRPILLRQKPVLFMNNGVIGQDFDCFQSGSMNRFVFFGGHGKQFRQFNPKCDRYISLFTDDAAMFDSHDWKLIFQCIFFQNAFHKCLGY